MRTDKNFESQGTGTYEGIYKGVNARSVFIVLLFFRLREVVEPHGLMAGWFLTWFVHEFPKFEDSLMIFDFQLTELSHDSSDADVEADVMIAAALILLYKEKLIYWREDPFERVMFLRNLPKIAPVIKVVECARLLKAATTGKDVFIVQVWVIFIILLYVGDRLTSI